MNQAIAQDESAELIDDEEFEPYNHETEDDDGVGFKSREIVIDQSLCGERLDKALATLLPEYSRSQIKKAIESHEILLNHHPVDPKMKVYGLETIQISRITNPSTEEYKPEKIDLDVVYEDTDLIVINKPPGLVVHPAAGNWSGTLLNGLLWRYPELRQVPRAGIVHRLDKHTSGLMVVSRHIGCQIALIRQLQRHEFERLYVALVWGEPPPDGTIVQAIGRDPKERTRMAPVNFGGKNAVTHYRTLATQYYDHHHIELPISVVRCQLETGRTHQIRVHMAYEGYPLVGDHIYAHLAPRLRRMPLPMEWNRQALHAYKLSLQHPFTQQKMHWRAEIPNDFNELLISLAFDELDID